MPFDAAPVRSPLPDNIAAQSALVLDMVEFFFQGGANWGQLTFHQGDGKKCLLGAVQFVQREICCTNDCAVDYLAEVMSGGHLRTYRNTSSSFLSRCMVFSFNDTHTYADIATVLRKAREMAAADASAEAARNAT
jgi:hypothetical protein